MTTFKLLGSAALLAATLSTAHAETGNRTVVHQAGADQTLDLDQAGMGQVFDGRVFGEGIDLGIQQCGKRNRMHVIAVGRNISDTLVQCGRGLQTDVIETPFGTRYRTRRE